MKHTDGSQNNEVALRDTEMLRMDYPMDRVRNVSEVNVRSNGSRR